MNENAKTLTLVAVAAGVVVLAIVTRPSLPVSSQESLTNQPLYANFTDPLAVTNLEIVEYDEGRGEVLPFQVAQVPHKGKNLWSIPSHDDYPADAKDQVASAAAGLMGLKVLEMVSDNQGDQREYGVIDPDPKALKVGQTGVGEKVIMKNKEGKELLALVIGKEVPGRPGLRYVRKVGQAPIYVVEAKTDKLSTKFENWIERNLLQISSFDIKRLLVRDHSVDELRGALFQRGETALEYNDAGEPKWKLIEDKKFTASKERPDEGQWVPVKLAADQELNAAKLDELKTALDDLKIVDVSRKPAGLSADLKAAADFTTHRDAVESLAHKGFYAAELTKGQVELFSNEGEIRIVMKDGVEYVLRFGGIAGTSPTKKDEKPKGAGKAAGKEKEPEKKEGAGLSRYLFVMAEFNPDIIPKPQLEPLPEAKKEAAKKPPEEKKPAEAKKPADDKKAAPAPSQQKKTAEKKADEKKPEAKKADDKKPEPKKPQTEAEKKAEAAKAAEAEKAAKTERERIEKENKRKQEEYDQKVADGKKRVGELNNRFADWYYVISDDVYRKIHLNHDELFKKKEKAQEKKDEHAGHDHGAGKDEASSSDSLDKLKKEGPAAK
jgi:hypothetical protein